MIAVRHMERPTLWSQLFLALVLAVLASAGVLVSRSQGGPVSIEWGPAVGFAAAFFATRLLTIRLPQGDEVYVVAVVGLSALATADIVVVLLSSAAAGVVELFARLSQSSPRATQARALDILRSTSVLGILAPAQPLLHRLMSLDKTSDVLIGAVLAVGCLYVGLDVLTMAIQHRVSGGLPIAEGIASLRRPLVTMYLVHLAMAAVGVRLYATSGAWVFSVTLLLTLILQNSFNLYLRIRRGYGETIGALAHAAELDRPHDSGHARRVSDLSVAVGRRMGLASRELERIGYAALLHDIGMMGGAEANSESAFAQRGASIVASVPFLADVAPLIQAQSLTDDDGFVGGEIVRLCSRYDRLRADLGAAAALEALATQEGGLKGRMLEALDEVIDTRRVRVGVQR